ncbi:MAG: hypothetical protein OXU71_05850 [Gammaproteobacteria bacterium]|nr:hypothetical protein [Gammaproteobacteria bacterium]
MRRGKKNSGKFAVATSGGHRYDDSAFNRRARATGLKRLFLHAESLRFKHLVNGTALKIYAPLPGELEGILGNL